MKQLDAAGSMKLQTLEEAMVHAQRLNTIVERMAVAVRAQQECGPFVSQLRRTSSPLVGMLKPQFGMIAEQVSSLLLSATRGGGDQARLRMLREGVAQLRAQLELTAARVKDKHAIAEEPRATRGS